MAKELDYIWPHLSAHHDKNDYNKLRIGIGF